MFDNGVANFMSMPTIASSSLSDVVYTLTNASAIVLPLSFCIGTPLGAFTSLYTPSTFCTQL